MAQVRENFKQCDNVTMSLGGRFKSSGEFFSSLLIAWPARTWYNREAQEQPGCLSLSCLLHSSFMSREVHMRHEFSAVLVGGPPHSGKSVLTYSLTQALRQRQVSHYVLRACPDGEGDWSMESPPDTVRLLRNKGLFTDQWVDQICRDLQQRHLPLLVDVGGRPTANQQRILAAAPMPCCWPPTPLGCRSGGI